MSDERRCPTCKSRLAHNTFTGWTCGFCSAHPVQAEFIRQQNQHWPTAGPDVAINDLDLDAEWERWIAEETSGD